ncbi:MAG: hypothetical protein B6244_01190 [Candidatus Cloacimonetes bacterium 4572_55]|nr:MAG: hypothetical protein B6244_01190 [Candidatus Cloacimonetes bacterium 4572_55]
MKLNKQEFIRTKAIENLNDPEGREILWSRHGITELLNDDLNRIEVEKAFTTCEIIEDCPTQHRPLPDCLVLSLLKNSKPIHAVVAIDENSDRIFVVTVYRPSKERWENDWRTRK